MNKSKNNTTLILLLLLCSFTNIKAQNRVNTFIISGVVSSVNSNEKLPGVNVYLKGTTTGTVTNENGYYSLKLPEGNATIVYSFIGYQSIEKSINLKSDKTLNITLEQNEEMLQEIRITSQRKFFGNMDYGREIPTVKSEEIEKLNSTNASDILHARLSGVWATKTSGAPGDQEKIRIRGQASFFSSSEPLYVIDGVPVPIVNLASLGIGDLNMHDIESVTVLKDASSTALYGYQGGNGVVLIDTKHRSDHKLEFSSRTGYQWFNNYYDLMNTKDFLELLELAKQTIGSPISEYYLPYSSDLCDHDRQSEIFQHGKAQEYQLSGGGNVGKFSYYLSGNYTRQTGIIKKTEFEKYNALARVSYKLNNKLALDFSYRWSYQENLNNQNEYMGNPVIFKGVSTAPCLECTPDSLLYDPVARNLWSRSHSYYELLNLLAYPKDMIESRNQSYNFFSNAASLMARYQVNKHLSVNVIESFMNRNSDYSLNTVFYRTNLKFYSSPEPVDMKSNENVALLNHQANVSYNGKIKLHEFNFMFAHRYYADNLHWQVDSLGKTIPEHYYLRNSMAGYGPRGSVIRKMTAYIAHFSYNYQQKYFLSAVANVSRLKEGLHVDYYTVFPSVSLSWDISKEPFLDGARGINELNIYTNYGTSGNYPLNGLSNNLFYDVYTTFNDVTTQHPAIKQFANHYLKHESTAELDFGLKGSLLNDRLNFSAAWYSKQIGNQIIQRDIPYYYGGGKIFINLGNIAVHGYEFNVDADLLQQKNLSWSLTGNFSASRQKVIKLADGQDLVFDSADRLFPDFIIKESSKLGDIYGYKYLGKWTAEDEMNKSNIYANVMGLKFLNADTTYASGYGLKENDKVIIGNSIPDFNWNLMSSFQYKDFSIEVVIYSSWGVQKFNETRAGTMNTGVNRDIIPFYRDSLKGIQFQYLWESSYFLEDASFIRLKTLSLNYEPHQKVFGLKTRFTLSFENLLTFTKYKGYDPEATIFTDNNFSDNAVDRGAFPNPKSVYLTLQIKL
ncbi:MAG: SusC/RagA family TonB-linked outer membrane protein [Prolixibacteraceae bacterium]